MRCAVPTGDISKFVILLFLFGAPGNAQVAVLTQHNDAARDGLNASETTLTLSSVSPGNFGKLVNLPTDGAVYAQPLVVPGVTIPGKGTHDVVYVATMHDSVYAYDADGLTLTPLWQESLAALGCPSGCTCTSVLTKDEYVSATDIQPEIGILSTPVIDLSTHQHTVCRSEDEGSFRQNDELCVSLTRPRYHLGRRTNWQPGGDPRPGTRNREPQ